MHLALSLTFLLFFIGTVLATIHSRFWPLLRGNPYLVYKLVLDLASVVFLAGAGMALYRRIKQRPPQLTLTRSFTLVLMLLACIVANGLMVTGLRLAILQPAVGRLDPRRLADCPDLYSRRFFSRHFTQPPPGILCLSPGNRGPVLRGPAVYQHHPHFHCPA
jgi:hypothetical protein